MNTDFFTGLYRTTKRLLKKHAFFLYMLHPSLLVVTGYYLVQCPLPVMVKTTLFGIIFLASGWLAFRCITAFPPLNR